MNNRHIENIVIGKPLCDPKELLAENDTDWIEEENKTFYTEERFLPKILVELGFYKSNSEIKRNRPDLFINLDKIDFYDKLKVSKKNYVWIIIGE